MAFARFMASLAGRGLRIAAGLALVFLGIFGVGGTAGWVVAAVGLVPLLAGVFNVCLFGPLLGAPFDGSKLPPAGAGPQKLAGSR